jgi:hypothetical protein
MSKLLRLREWVTVPEAAKHLTNLFAEDISEADVLRLALDGELVLSVYLLNHAQARCGTIKSPTEATYFEVPADLNAAIKATSEAQYTGAWIKMPRGVKLENGEVIDLGDEIHNLEGVFDLPMIGGERLDVEHRFQQLTGGPPVTLTTIDGSFVQVSGTQYCQIQSHFEDNEFFDKAKLRKPWNHPENFFPAGGLPEDSVLVVRTEYLFALQQASLVGREQGSSEKPVSQREHTSYLNIIGAMLEMLMSPRPGRETQSGVITEMVEGWSDKSGISKANLEKKFAEAKRKLKE